MKPNNKCLIKRSSWALYLSTNLLRTAFYDTLHREEVSITEYRSGNYRDNTHAEMIHIKDNPPGRYYPY